MAYTPTIWQDLPSQSTPLNAVNLNKIEQGIADAHAAIALVSGTNLIALDPVSRTTGTTYQIDASINESLAILDRINAEGILYIDVTGTPGQDDNNKNLVSQHLVDVTAVTAVTITLVTGAGKFASANNFSIDAGKTARFRFEYINGGVPVFAALSGVTGGGGGGGGGSYTHTQVAANAVWTIVHNLGYNPANIFAQDDQGETISGFNVTYDNPNQLTITHGYSLAGTATVS